MLAVQLCVALLGAQAEIPQHGEGGPTARFQFVHLRHRGQIVRIRDRLPLPAGRGSIIRLQFHQHKGQAEDVLTVHRAAVHVHPGVFDGIEHLHPLQGVGQPLHAPLDGVLGAILVVDGEAFVARNTLARALDLRFARGGGLRGGACFAAGGGAFRRGGRRLRRKALGRGGRRAAPAGGERRRQNERGRQGGKFHLHGVLLSFYPVLRRFAAGKVSHRAGQQVPSKTYRSCKILRTKKARREAAAFRRAFVVYFWRLRAPAPQRRGMATTAATPSARPTAIFRVSAPLAAAAAESPMMKL